MKKRRIIETIQEPKAIGVTPSGKRVWLETQVTLKYSDGTVEIFKFDRGTEAHEFLLKAYKKDSIDDTQTLF